MARNNMNESLLEDVFRAQLSKMDYNNRSEAVPDIGYPTGFLNIDYNNAYIAQEYYSDLDYYKDYFNIGIADGSFVSFIGHTSTGKSTLMVQIAFNIIRNFKSSQVWYDQTELKAMNLQRVYELSRLSKEDFKKRAIIRNAGVTIENVFDRINLIYKIKTSDPDKYLYNTGRKDLFGKPIMKFEPTVYLIDSIAAIMPEDVEEGDELAGKSFAMQSANKVTTMIKQIMSKLQAANIILMITNHILEDINMSMMPKQNPVPYLKPGERMPKGRTVTYLANNIWRIDKAGNLKVDDSYHIEGAIVNISMVKSRASGIKTSTRMINHFGIGFDPWLSLLEVMKVEKLIYGAGVSLSLDEDKTYKFSYGTFKKKVAEDPEFRKYVLKHVLAYLKSIPVYQKTSTSNDFIEDLITDDLFTVN